MGPPPSTTAATSDSLLPMHNTKLRLMCSYGGHIVPRPNSKNLCYIGGDTRIVAVDRRTTGTSLSSFTAHLSSTLLRHHRSFIVKYQLPHHDLDALISLATDDDLHLMIDEYDRLSSSAAAASSRLRLFLFRNKNDHLLEGKLHDSPFDSWFVDALKSTKIMRKKERSEDSGSGSESASGEVQSEGLSGGGEVKSCGGDLCSVPESIVLETSSSFGSASSSVSLSNLPPIKIHAEDGNGWFNLLDNNKGKVTSLDSNVSDNSVASAISHPQMGTYQETIVQVTSSPVEVDSNVSSPNSGTQIHETVQVSGYPISAQFVQPEQQQQLQFVSAGAHYLPHYTTGPLPMSSYYQSPMYHPQQKAHYQPNQPYPVYFLPVGHTQPYNLPMQYNLIDAGSVATSSGPPMHSTATMIPSQVVYKEIPANPTVTESAMKAYRTVPATTPLIHVPSNQNQQQLMDLPQMHHASQSITITSMDTANYCNELDDDPAHTQIYKSQPPAPSLPSQYRTMTKATTLLLSEGLTTLHNDDTQ